MTLKKLLFRLALVCMFAPLVLVGCGNNNPSSNNNSGTTYTLTVKANPANGG